MFAPASQPARWRIIAAFAAVYLIWGSTYLGIRFALESLPPLFIAGVRFLIAGTILFLFTRRQGAPLPTAANWRTALLIGGLMFFGANSAVMVAQQRVSSGMTSLLLAVVPIVIALEGWVLFRGERPSGRVFLGLFIGLTGIILLIGPGNLGGQVDLLGAGLLLGSSFIWAFASLLSGRLSRPASALQSASLNLLCGGALLMTGSLLIGEWSHINLAAVSVKSLLAVAYLSTMGSAVAFAAYMWLLTVVPANRVVTYAYVNPVIAVFLGWALAGETITANTIIAAAIIIAAVVLITSAPAKPVTVSTPQPTRWQQTGARLKAIAARSFSQIL